MRGIASVIVFVLMIMIIVGVSSVALMFLGGFFSDVSLVGDSRVENTTEKMSSCIRIEDFNPQTRNATIRNCGQTEIGGFTIMMDGSILYAYTSNFMPNAILNVNLNVPKGEHTLFAVSGDAESRKILVEVRNACDGVQPPESGDWIVDSNTYCTCPLNGNITVRGNIYVLGDSVLNINGCLLLISQSSDYQYGRPIVRFYGTSRVNVWNSIVDSQRLFDISVDESSKAYFESVAFTSRSSIACLGTSSLTAKDSSANSISFTGGTPSAMFMKLQLNSWSNTGGFGSVAGNISMSGASWTGGYIEKSMPIIITNRTGHPIPAMVNITKVGGGFVWGPQGIVDGYVEPSLIFGSTNYSASDLRVYVTNGINTNWTSLNFQTATPIRLTL